MIKRLNFLLLTIFIGLSFLLMPAISMAGGDDAASLRAEMEALKAKLAEMDDLKVKLAEMERKLAAVEDTQAEQEKAITVKTAAAEDESVKDITIGGAMRVNYSNKDWSSKAKDKGGDMGFDIFRLDVNGEYNKLLISAQYRWYSYMDVIHHAWVGYNFTDNLQGQLGITQVPFGLLPYASHNWWFGVPYYVGLEDDYDMGAKLLYKKGPLDIQFAFFKNEEWGSSSDNERYSFDVINKGGLNYSNEEDNQFNLRVAYTFDHGELGSTEIGFSGEWGMLYNDITEDHGDHWAAAAHLNGHYGPWNLMLEAVRYEYDPKNPDGANDDNIRMGAFATDYDVAAEGNIYVANVSYGLPVEWGPITKLTFYNDYSILDKDIGNGDNSIINTLGCMVSSGPIYTYIDFIMGRNMVWLGADSDALGDGEDDDWHMRFNVNVGYYF